MGADVGSQLHGVIAPVLEMLGTLVGLHQFELVCGHEYIEHFCEGQGFLYGSVIEEVKERHDEGNASEFLGSLHC